MGPQFDSKSYSSLNLSLLALNADLILFIYALLIFLFISAILASMHLFLFRGCSLRGAGAKLPLYNLLIGSLGTLGSTNLSSFSDSLSFSFI